MALYPTPPPHVHVHVHTYTHVIIFRMKLEAAQAETVLLGEACHFLGIPVVVQQNPDPKVWTRV